MLVPVKITDLLNLKKQSECKWSQKLFCDLCQGWIGWINGSLNDTDLSFFCDDCKKEAGK